MKKFVSILIGLVIVAGAARAATTPNITFPAASVQKIIQQAANTAAATAPATNFVIAVVDREGFVLAVYGTNATPTTAQEADAVAKGGTGSFLSSLQNAFTSRTAGFIIQDHFPPGIKNEAPGPLLGVGFSQLPFSNINIFSSYDTMTPILGTSLSGTPGGLPLYIGGVLVGGVGVTGSGQTGYVAGNDTDEQIALGAQSGFGPSSSIVATQVLINGFRLPYTGTYTISSKPVAINPAHFSPRFPNPYAHADYVPKYRYVTSYGPPQLPPPGPAPGHAPTPTIVPPPPSPFADIPGELRYPIRGDPDNPAYPYLTAADVSTAIHLAAQTSEVTRAAIRLPVGVPARFWIVVVNNPYTHGGGVPPKVLGVLRTADAPLFSYDVATQKACTSVFFSSPTLALSTRAVGFLAADMYPPGINGTAPGPYFPLQPLFSATVPPANPPDANLPDGITIFPGGIPLYRAGVLVGAIGVSGDGVDQDDLIAASGTVNLLAPTNIRSDEFTYRGARLPYVNFPRTPGL